MPALDPATAAVRTGVRSLLVERLTAGALERGDLVLAACSGGADSLALAAQLAFCAPRLGLRAGLVTVDHALQPGSAAQAARVAEQGRALGLDPVLVYRAADSAGSAGPEGEARNRRLRALADARAESGARAVLLGHTMEDQAETVLLALARGSGTRALAGMAAVRGRLWRPLLGVRRAQTERACRDLGLDVWHDPTNDPDGPWRTAAGTALPRAAVRARVLPALAAALGQDPVSALARTATIAGQDADHLDRLAADVLAGLLEGEPDEQSEPGEQVEPVEPGTARGSARGEAGDVVHALAVAIEALEHLPAAVLGRVLRGLLLHAGAPAGALGHVHVLAVTGLIADWHGQGPIVVPGGVEVSRGYGRLSLVRPTERRRSARAAHRPTHRTAGE
ncbi:tRNA lysidine(34) synthetase TilS [Pseudactinotalea sp. HY158]|uniref:tRNA lysidine(34) synthetase TilS n=1 Tax=Pseudactinotalea sp. HY158 TaxID=2654547 RepID=UPI00129C7D00|nr:tRNA lysidine(34) synthetase TilS [Pseudactinotalea sp. HY158]QGH68405.1 tRNA lysidine(34) synthetase TilS [Pseudactinotalea sp. HY158]